MTGPAWSDSAKYTVAVDFDGVIHSYTTRWQSAEIIPDPPVLGALGWLAMIKKDFQVAIFSTRCADDACCAAVRDYLQRDHDRAFDPAIGGVIDAVQFGLGDDAERFIYTNEKVPALLYVDDRGYRFEGTNFPTAEEIHQLRPWNKRPMGLK